MRTKRFLKALSLVLVLAMTVASFAACGEEDKPAAETNTNQQTNTNTATTDTKKDEPAKVEEVVDPYAAIKAKFPKKDMGGIEVKILDWWTKEYTRGTDTDYGEARAEYLAWAEEYYNFTIVEESYGDWGSRPEDFQNYATAEDDGNYYIWILYQTPASVTAISQGLVKDMSKLGVDLTADKWDKYFASCFGGSNGEVYAFRAATSEPRGGVYFNKRLLKEAGIDPESIYELQKNNQWTWEVFEDMCKQICKDTDNDGVYDVWALCCDSTQLYQNFLWSNNTNFVDRVDGKFVYTLEDAASIEALDFAQHLSDEYRYYPEGSEWNYWQTAYPNAQGVFIFQDAYCAGQDFKDMEDDFGFVCMPMGPNATHYASVNNDNLYVIPSNYSDEKAALIAMAYDLYTEPVPGFEDHDGSLDGYYSQFRDSKSVDETIVLIKQNQVMNWTNFIADIALGSDFVWGLGSWTTASAKAEEIRDKWKAAIDAANK